MPFPLLTRCPASNYATNGLKNIRFNMYFWGRLSSEGRLAMQIKYKFLKN